MRDQLNGVWGRSSRRIWVAQTEAFARRQLRETTRSKVALFWSFGFPAIWYLLTVHFSAIPGSTSIGGSAAKAVHGISFGIFGAFTVTLVGFSGALTTDLDAKRYRKFRSLPLAPSADLTGRLLAGAILGIGSCGLTIGVAIVDGAAYRITAISAALIVILAVVSFCIIGMIAGLATALVLPRPEHATTAGTGIIVIWFFLTGYNGTLPSVFPGPAWSLNLLPNSLATRLLILHTVDVDWQLLGLSPPPTPATPGYPVLLLGVTLLLTFLAVAIMNNTVYGTDLGE